MKTYVLLIAKTFPKNHQLAGDNTHFIDYINNALNNNLEQKIHTVRGNYQLWEKRFIQINKGTAQISLRYWSSKPYHSKQITICNLTKADGIGLQKLRWDEKGLHVDKLAVNIGDLAKNDGLSKGDMYDWITYNTDMALIHFSSFRYINMDFFALNK